MEKASAILAHELETTVDAWTVLVEKATRHEHHLTVQPAGKDSSQPPLCQHSVRVTCSHAAAVCWHHGTACQLAAAAC